MLRQVDLTVEPGESVAVRGPSGSGKSTLLDLMAGLLQPDQGRTFFQGRRFDTLSDAARSEVRLRRFGLVFQAGELIPELTLLENITLPLRLSGRLPRGLAVPEPVADVLDRLGIAGLTGRLPTEVSGGELQRAAVARAVVHRPALVLADEPTASLDDATARSTMTLLLGLARDVRAAVVVVTHDDVVAARCDRSLSMRGGVLAATATEVGSGSA